MKKNVAAIILSLFGIIGGAVAAPWYGLTVFSDNFDGVTGGAITPTTARGWIFSGVPYWNSNSGVSNSGFFFLRGTSSMNQYTNLTSAATYSRDFHLTFDCYFSATAPSGDEVGYVAITRDSGVTWTNEFSLALTATNNISWSVAGYSGPYLIDIDTSGWTDGQLAGFGFKFSQATSASADHFNVDNVLLAVHTNATSYYTLTVTNGSGSGSYTNGHQVAIAASNLTGKVFVKWTGDTQYLASAASTSSNTVIMSTNAVTLTATYNPAYLLTVNDGTGGGWYTNGHVQMIEALVPAVFVKWTGDTQYVDNVTNSIANVTMPATNVTLTASNNPYMRISYLANNIIEVANLFGGAANGRYEPGETIDITVSNRNDGTLDASLVTNSLSADPAYFTISNLTSSTYPSMPVGTVTSTVYRVTILAAATNGTYLFSVTNRAGANIWAGSFPLDVFKQSLPAVSPPSITMSVLPGATVTNTQVTVTNSGNTAFTFNITDNGTWESSYVATIGTLGSTAFATYNDVIVLKDPDVTNPYNSSTNDGVSVVTSLGFNFPFYGTTYSNFYVTADGYIGLSNTTNVPVQSTDWIGPLPVTNATTQIIAPFWGALRSPASSIRYNRDPATKRLAISFSGVSKEGGTPLGFQAALFTNGCIELRYATITGVTNSYGQTNVTIGVQGSTTSYTNLTMVKPGNGTSILLTPQKDQWVSYAPAQNVTVAPLGSQVITFIANAAGKAAGVIAAFNAQFNWSTGGSSNVSVTANVVAAAPIYSAVSSLSFTGLAGQVTSVPFIIHNTNGTGTLTFTISDSTALAAGYSTTNPAYSWIDISSTGITVPLNDPDPSPYITAADEGFSAMIPMKFAFPFYGGSYTQLCISVNGALWLDTTGRVYAAGSLASLSSNMPAQMIAPYWGDLVIDTNATIKYYSTAEQIVITWENVRQYGFDGGSNQTFQAVLKPSGDITFQYKKLEGQSWANTTIGLRDRYSTGVRYGTATLWQPSDWIVSTNQYGMVSTQYVNVVSNRAFQIRPTKIRTIGYTPSSGTIAAGSNAVITITGDASNQQAGTNNISTNTTLTITHNASTNVATLAVMFTVTNSQETVFVRAAASELADGSIDSDGDGVSDDLERIAGTDPQNADSVFTPTIGRDSSGTYLSWPAPLDGVQRNYTLYFTTNLMSLWEYLYTVTNGVTYLDAVHSNVPAIYYKITVPMQ
ncbi:MAG: hypothetical protein WCH86_00575 [Kiritimatiellales bacterium]